MTTDPDRIRRARDFYAAREALRAQGWAFSESAADADEAYIATHPDGTVVTSDTEVGVVREVPALLAQRDEDARNESARRVEAAIEAAIARANARLEDLREKVATLRLDDPHFAAMLAGKMEDVEDGADECPEWWTDAACPADLRDRLRDALTRIGALEECPWVADFRREVRWTYGLVKARGGKEVRVGKIAPVKAADRLTSPLAPMYRLDISAPWVLIADQAQLERGIHELVMGLEVGDRGLIRRKPDIATYAATLARFGPSGAYEAQAVASAIAHPHTAPILRGYGYDPLTGQGLLLSPLDPAPEAPADDGGRLTPDPEAQPRRERPRSVSVTLTAGGRSVVLGRAL